MILKRGILAVFLALVLSAPSLAANYEAGQEAYDRGDYATALKEWRPLAEQGDARAQHLLGAMYGFGEGVPQDYVQAHMWFNLAAASRTPGVDRDRAVRNREIVAKLMTPAEVAEAQRLAREWKPK